MEERIKTYAAFYQFYLREHQNKANRILHFLGTFIIIMLASYLISSKHQWMWVLIPLIGYGFAWVGHFFFEKNKPATFKYPLWSLISDFKLFFDLLLAKRHFDARRDPKVRVRRG